MAIFVFISRNVVMEYVSNIKRYNNQPKKKKKKKELYIDIHIHDNKFHCSLVQ